MQYLEIIVSFLLGALLLTCIGLVFSLKTKGIFRLLMNTAAGGVFLLLLTVFKVAYLPLNPLNALIVGFLGVPGVAVIFLIITFL